MNAGIVSTGAMRRPGKQRIPSLKSIEKESNKEETNEENEEPEEEEKGHDQDSEG
jgi:hypothetical protein